MGPATKDEHDGAEQARTALRSVLTVWAPFSIKTISKLVGRSTEMLGYLSI